jgi:hypothetical protein
MRACALRAVASAVFTRRVRLVCKRYAPYQAWRPELSGQKALAAANQVSSKMGPDRGTHNARCTTEQHNATGRAFKVGCVLDGAVESSVFHAVQR